MIDRTTLAGLRRIASRANPRIKEWAGLKEKDNRDALGLTIAEGVNLVAEGLSSSKHIFFTSAAFIVSDSGAERPEAGELLSRAKTLGLQLFNLADDCYEKISGLHNSEGLALLVRFSPTPPVTSDLFAQPGARWLIAAGVQDPGNAGALARTALAAGMSGCLFLDGADPHSPKFLRGSMGAAFRLPCLSLSEDEFISQWQTAKPGVRLIAATSANTGMDYRKADYSSPLALLFGGERGIPNQLAALATNSVHIPLQGEVESLNLAVAAGILLFEAERKH